jgi:hypothetical protein
MCDWIARCKEWRLEGVDGEKSEWEWEMQRDEEESVGESGEEKATERWVVRTLERNWARFMRIID